MVANKISTAGAFSRPRASTARALKRDHFGFALFLLLLLIAPRILLNVEGLPAASSLPVGFVGLGIWALLSPHHLDRIRNVIALPIPLTLVAFGIYAVSISLVSGNKISVGYSLQAAFYIVMGFLMVSGYLKHAIEMKRTKVTFRIVSAISVVFLLGTIVSIWIGPIYPHQVNPHDLLAGINRGMGFSEGTNSAAATVLALVSVAAFVNKRSRPIFVGLFVAALFLTFSRSAIIAFGVSLGVLVLLKMLNSFLSGRNTTQLIFAGWMVALVVVVSPFVLRSFPSIYSFAPVAGTIERFDPNDQSDRNIEHQFGSRIRIWTRGLNDWAESTPLQIIFGKGFRGSQPIVARGFITPHNSYISLLGDVGLVGFWLFTLPILWLIMSLGLKIATARHNSLDTYTFLALTSLAIHNMTGIFFYSPVLISLVLLILVFHAGFQTFKPRTETTTESANEFPGPSKPGTAIPSPRS